MSDKYKHLRKEELVKKLLDYDHEYFELKEQINSIKTLLGFYDLERRIQDLESENYTRKYNEI